MKHIPDPETLLQPLVQGYEWPPCPPSISLLGGTTGQVVLYGYAYLHYQKDSYRQRCMELFDVCARLMAETVTGVTLSSGFTGFAWATRHLIAQGVLDRCLGEDLEEIDSYIAQSLHLDFQQKNYDMLHGMIGKGLYFLEALPQYPTQEVLTQIVHFLRDMAVPQPDGTVSWKDCVFAQSQPHLPRHYNYGLAHGVPSVLLFLCKAYQQQVAPAVCQSLLETAIPWLLKSRRQGQLSQFPLTSEDPRRESRLAWCYGDLGPAVAIWQASVVLKRTDWQEAALSIALQATQRTCAQAHIYEDTEKKHLDTGFCHGTAGLAHIFYRFYQATNHPEFRNQADYWLAHTCRMWETNQHRDGHIGFPVYNTSTQVYDWLPDASLLEGMTGVMLVALSRINPAFRHWDHIFLTDI